MSSRKSKTTETKTMDYDAVVKALKAVKINKKSLRDAAAAFGLSKSSLGRYVKNFDEKEKAIYFDWRSTSYEDLDFCIICSQFLPQNMMNTVECIKKCGIVHKQCAKANAFRFVCERCDEDLDEISDEVEEPEDDE